MKKLMLLAFALLCLKPVCGQINSPGRIRVLPQDSSLLVSGSDSSHLYNALLIARQMGSISSATVVCKHYNAATAQWVTDKDTAYAWSLVTITSHNNQAFKICKLNGGILKLCLGRLGSATRKKFIFTLSGSNGVFTKEFDF
jgi:hypothetical protein